MQDSFTERVGRYQLLEPIGGGPNGSVWRAKVFGVAGFERQFAVKRFLPELTSSPSAAQSLSAAARSYGSLEHPRIARMSEFGVAQGQTFTAVELVIGIDAARLVAESKIGASSIPPGGALALVSQAARAVGYAHGRGLSHLGLSPSNVIVTPDGDVKVTDFGVLAATITARPVDTPRLVQRLGYLAPEQLVGESTSAATDVFVLGVIAYELVTGQRAFYGDTPHGLVQAILAGPPSEPSLPRPIVRVLSRCLARSQFERFPDARAFADALDAALRVAPVPGTRKDIGAQVKGTLDRMAAMNEGQLSGVVAINVSAFRGGDNLATQPSPVVPHHEPEIATTDFVRPDVPVARPAPLVGPARRNDRDGSPSSTVPDLPKPITTVPGLVVPPPIPVPPGISSPQPPPIPVPGSQVSPHTMLGMQAMKPPPIPSVKKPGGPLVPAGAVAPGIPAIPVPNLRTTMPGGAAAPLSPTAFARGAPASDPNAAVTATGLDLAALESAARRADIPRGDNGHDNDIVEIGAATFDRSLDRTPPVPRQDKSALSDDPPTVPHDVRPEVHARGGLQPFAPLPRGDVAVRTDTAPSIEVIRDSAVDPSSLGDPLADPPTLPETPAHMGGDPARLAPGGAASPRNAPPSVPPFGRDLPTGQMPPQLVRDLKRMSVGSDRADVYTDPLVEMSLEVHGGERLDLPSIAPQRPSPSAPPPPTPSREGAPRLDRMPSPTPPSLVTPAGGNPAPDYHAGLAGPGIAPVSTVPNLVPPPPNAPGPRMMQPGQAYMPVQQARRSGGSKRWLVITLLLLVVGAGIGVFVWQMKEAGESDVASNDDKGSNKLGSNAVTTGSNAAGSNVVATGSNTGSNTKLGSGAGSNVVATHVGSGAGSNVDATHVGSGAGSNVVATHVGSGADAGSGSKQIVQPTGNSDALQIASAPAGARVFIDGADQGVTPVKLPGSTDRHSMALVLAGHDLYVAEVDGHGAFQIAMKPITPAGGPAGIKVIKCQKDRYYVFVDGKPTGMTCPTERIQCETGTHTVEVYDVVTESRRKWDINVTDTRLSYRVRVE